MHAISTDIDVKNLCSRKLWELLRDQHTAGQVRPAIEAELLARQHYVTELQRFKLRVTARRVS